MTAADLDAIDARLEEGRTDIRWASRHMCSGQTYADIAAMAAELRELRAKLARVEALHRPGGSVAPGSPSTDGYCQEDGYAWPCPTREALADPEESE